MVSTHIKTMLGCLFVSEIISLTLGFLAWYCIFYPSPDQSGSYLDMYAYSREAAFVCTGVLVSLFTASVLRFHHELATHAKHYRVFADGYFFRSLFVFAIVVGVWALIVLLFFGHVRVSVLLLFFGISQGTDFMLKRLISSLVSRIYSRRANTRNILIVGLNKRSFEFMNFIVQNRLLGFKILGVIDDISERKPEFFDTVNYLGSFDEIEELFRRRIIDAVAIFLPLRTYYDQSLKVLRLAEKYGVSVDFMNIPFDPGLGKFRSTQIGDMSDFLYYTAPTESFALLAKRAMDILGVLAFFFFCWPLFLGIAAYIRLTDGGPVFFVQRRIGYNKRVFPMLKFRTMVPDAENRLEELADLNEMDGAAFKIANDPRLIKGGAFLRRYSLDELPQFLNVLLGSMSLVGPRPLSVRDYNLLPDDWQLRRFSMKPGLTCIWQVSGRNSLLFDDWMKMDLDYIDHWSLWLDVQILLKTVAEVFRGGGK